MKSRLKILFCPVHYVYDEKTRGSELAWAFNIANRISLNNSSSKIVTGFKNILNKKPYEIIELQPSKTEIDLSLINSLFFNLKYSAYSWFINIKEKFVITHHVLPFVVGKTFDLFKIIFPHRSKYIIGPIQFPLPFFDDNMSDYNHQTHNKFKSIIESTLLNLFNKTLSFLSKKTLLSADKIIVINEEDKKKIVKLGILSNKISLITPGIDTKKFNLIKPKKYFNGSKKLELLSVSYLVKRKNINKIIKVLASVVSVNKNVHLTIIGDGPQMNILVKLVDSLNLKNHVTFLGFIENNLIMKAYQMADLYITASKNETWGQVYLEAMACGLPILTAENQGSKKIIDDTHGYIIKNDYINKGTQAILKWLKNPKLIKQMSISSRKKAIKLYDWDTVIISKYLNIYKSLTK